MRSMSVAAAARVRKASTASRWSAVVSSSTSGCSGAMTAYVMPKLVSGRVVKTRTRQAVAALDGQVELRALGPADPVALHGLGPFGPLEVVEGLEELVGVLGDAEEPLLEVTLLDDVAGAVTGAVGQHLLVGQHGLTAGTPVDRGQGPVGQAGLPEAQEDELVPLDVGGIVAVDLAAPVVDGAEPTERRRELGDPGVGEDPRMGPRLDGGVLGGQAEGIEPDRAQDPLALHGLVADGQVAEGVVPDVALVGRPRRVGVHAQRVELLPRIVVVDLVGALVIPVALPLALHRIDVVCACHATRVGDTLVGSEPNQGVPAGSDGSSIRPSAGVRDGPRRVSPTASVALHHWGRSSAGRAPDWQSGGSWVQVPSPPPKFLMRASGFGRKFRRTIRPREIPARYLAPLAPLAVSLHCLEPTDVRGPSRRRRHADRRGTGGRTCEGRSPDRGPVRQRRRTLEHLAGPCRLAAV